MRPGELISERFAIERRAGSGGMSVVYRAWDKHNDAVCAIKVLAGTDRRLLERFDREARVLADLRHPGIVAYLDHGVTADGDRFLAMEWLEGEDLSERLARAPLSIGEALTLLRVVAEALGFAHARGVVHRDIKPSNLYLPVGRIDRVKVLDFGIARLLDDTGDPTRTGVRVGTPAYMSPEQARGLSQIDGRTDVFSLGCVLYQGLTGRKAFTGDDMLAVLAKILLEEPVPIDHLRGDAPPALSELVGRMLSKNPDARPRDGGEVVAEAARIAAEHEPRARRPSDSHPGRTHRDTQSPAALTVRERRLTAVVVTHDPGAARRADELRAAIERATAGPGATGGVRLETLKDGTILVVITGTEAATDLAARAARAALALRAQIGDRPIALATGRAVVSAEVPVGEVIERASRLLRAITVSEHDGTTDGRAATRRRDLDRAIRVDEVTAGLLDARFEISGDLAGLALVGERAAVDITRTLLGKPTPCVGRDAELATLEAAYVASAEGEARAVLITAPAGVGKSRLRYELLRRLSARDSGPSPEIWIARGDPLSAGAPFGMIAGALRRAAGILDGEPIEVRQAKLRARVARHVDDAELGRVAEFLGELIGAPFDDVESVQLRAARRDAMLMGDQMRRAWEDFLVAECEYQPVVLVLEDLQWGDTPTVSYVDSALRRLRELPLLVVALARPEAHELFPRLWSERGTQVIRLGELPRRAAERLVREVLGARATDVAVARLVERAAGNAFYLEELVRSVSEGRDELPETVLTMVQARLEAMEAEARRVLRAASVFGQVFWVSGVTALLGGKTQTEQVTEWLRELAAREVITVRADSRFPGQAEYVFRHALVREAAYAMLTDGDRALGHRLTGAWLERVGEPSAIVLAEHFERGGEPHNAVAWWQRAAEQALGGNDLEAVITACDRGVACGATGERLGALRLLEAEARTWRAEFSAAETCAIAAQRWLPPATEAWYAALELTATARYSLGDREGLTACAGALGDLALQDDVQPARLRTAARIVPQLVMSGATEEAEAIWEVLLASSAAHFDRDPALAGAILAARGTKSFFEGNPAEMLELHVVAADACVRAGDLRRAMNNRGSAGYACLELGSYDEAVTQLREVHDATRRLGLTTLATTARQNLGLALAYAGALDEARIEEGHAVQEFLESGNRRMEAASRYYLGYIRMFAGDLSGAEKSTQAAVEMALGPPLIPTVRAEGLGILAAIHLAQGRADDARTAAAEAMALLDEMGGIDGGESIIRLAYAEALRATGDTAGADAAIAAAQTRLLARAEKITQLPRRASFLEKVPENARTLELARAWLGA